MSVITHPDYHRELENLRYTLARVEEHYGKAMERHDRLGCSVHGGPRYYKSDNSQEYIDMLINQQIYASLSLKMRNLEAARKKPYFARIDFKETTRDRAESLYIGKMSLLEDDTLETVIVDWRAPIANLYYEGRLGLSSYASPGGMVHGELTLKRQYNIEEAKLNGFMDIDITTNDQLLQASLGANAEKRLKDIVATIQTEQNQIIRAEPQLPLIVQGVAGSGKTTVALHRIAYLIYNFEHALKPENFMIVAPSRFFLNYISEVLPELGVENVKQTTFEDLAREWIGSELKIPDTFEKIRRMIGDEESESTGEELHYIENVARFKSGLGFKDLMDAYIGEIEAKILPNEDFSLDNWVIYTREEIADLFFREYKDWPVLRRLDQLKKHFNKRARDQRDAKVERLQRESNQRVAKIKMDLPESEERRQRVLSVIDQKDEDIGRVTEFAKNGATAYLKKIPMKTPIEYYKEFFENPAYFLCMVSEEEKGMAQRAREWTLKLFDQRMIEYEDLAPLIYFTARFHGLKEKVRVKHAVIDEAQDFSALQFLVLKEVMKESSFTILGDLNQGIHAYRGVLDWQDVRKRVFGEEHSLLLHLEQSYRTTVEIMDAANQVIMKKPNAELAKPVIRHGEPVKIITKKSRQEIVEEITETIRQWRGEELKSFAIISKTLQSARQLKKAFAKSGMELTLIAGKEREYNAGLVIVPSYLAKGLEFDVVFIPDAEAGIYLENELDIKLLYVAMTRPLHRLQIYYSKCLTPLLASIHRV